MRVLLAPLIFIIHTSLQIINLAICGGLVILFGLLKLALPVPVLRKVLTMLMNLFFLMFGRVSVLLIRLFNSLEIERRFSAPVSTDKWYLLVANHLSYLDIVLLIELSVGRIPPPKFFLKKELIWLPFVGLAAWALDMPFMRRYSPAYLKKYPHKKGKDIETTKAYCQRYTGTPTTVINFVEGTRFTALKHAVRKSQYQLLLPPKAGGVAFTLATMGDLFTNMLDISLLYPENRKHPMMAMLSGQMRRIIIDVNVLEIPGQAKGDYFADEVFRARFQQWLNQLWQDKDKRMQRILEN